MTGMTLVRRSAEELMSAINSEHQQALGAARNTVEHALRCGELLVEAKTLVPYGTWVRWLGENTELSEWTAMAYMKLARGEAANPGSIQDSPTILAALRSLASPRRQPDSSASLDPESPAGKMVAATRKASHADPPPVIDATAVEEPPDGVEVTKWNTALDHVSQMQRCMGEATQEGLTVSATFTALTEGSMAARQVAIDLEQMAAVVRRRQA